MRRHVATAMVALAVVAAACSPDRPELSPLPELPEGFDFPTTSTTVDPIPDDGTCVLAESRGARVRETQPGYDAERAFLPGDVIVGFGGIAVTSQEGLIDAIARRLPGDVVDVAYLRDGVESVATVTLGAAPDDVSRPRLGVLVEPELAPVSPDELSPSSVLAPGAHLALVDGEVLAVDPLAGTWQATGVDVSPGDAVLLLDGELYTAPARGAPQLLPASGGPSLALPPEASGFVRILTGAGNRVITAIGPSTGEGGTLVNSLVVAIDPFAGQVVWGWNPLSGGEDPIEPVFGFRSPDGTQMVLTLDAGGTLLHSLIDYTGIRMAGYGSDVDLAPPDSLFAGWYDDDHPAFVTIADTGIDVFLHETSTATRRPLVSFDAGAGIRQLWAVGDGSHLVVVTENEATLLDAAAQRMGRLLARSCDVSFFLGPLE